MIYDRAERRAPASEPQCVYGEGGRLAGELAPWVSAVAVVRRGDLRFDWTRAWIEEWKATNWPEGPGDSVDDSLARWEAYRPELERAIAAGAPSGEYFYVEAVETRSTDAVRLPRDIFDGERDRRWIFNLPLGQRELLNRTRASR